MREKTGTSSNTVDLTNGGKLGKTNEVRAENIHH
jgi:hypothetical protein